MLGWIRQCIRCSGVSPCPFRRLANFIYQQSQQQRGVTYQQGWAQVNGELLTYWQGCSKGGQLFDGCYIYLMEKEEDNWMPLQSNPEVMNTFLRDLGFNTELYAVQDLLSVEEWAQEMLGQPVLGLIFLYEINQLQKEYSKLQANSLQNNKVSDNVFYMKQYAKNACGTIALFHVIMNNIYDHPDLVKENTYLSKFAEQNFGKTPAQIGQSFKLNKQVCQKHKQSVKKGQSKVQDKVETHFIAFIEKDGFLYELDGGKKQPINHGECTPEGLTFMACLIIQKFMQRDPDNNKFTILALGHKPQF